MAVVEPMEQPTVADAEQPTPTLEQPFGDVAGSGVEDVAAGAGDVAESPPIDIRSLLASDDGIKSLLADEQTGKTLKGYLEKEAKDAAFRERQAYEKELRMRASGDEAIAASAKRLALELGADPSDEAVRRYAETFTQPNREAAQVETALAWIDGAKQRLSPDGQAGIDMAVQLADNDPTALNGIVSQLWDGMAQNSAASSLAAYEAGLVDLKPEEVRQNPQLLAAFEKWREYEDSAEAGAQKVASTRIDPGPSTTTGRPVGSTKQYNLNDPIELLEAKRAGQITEEDAAHRLAQLWR